MTNTYEQKYKKYKKKYLALKGGNNNNIKNALDTLLESDTKSYTIANINLTSDEKKTIANINILQRQYSYIGKIVKDDQKKYISDFIRLLENNDNDSDKVADILVSKLIIPFLEANRMDSAWIIIRATKPDNYWDIHRWHCDGFYYQSETSNTYAGKYKIVLTLRGPGTLFIKENTDAKMLFNKLENEKLDELRKQIKVAGDDKIKEVFANTKEKYRKILNDALKEFPVGQLSNEEAMIFIASVKDRCLIHSEPPMHEDRIFISVVPGDYDNISKMVDPKEKLNTPMIR